MGEIAYVYNFPCSLFYQAPSNDPLDFAAEIAKKINQANRPPQAVEEKASTPKSKKKSMFILFSLCN